MEQPQKTFRDLRTLVLASNNAHKVEEIKAVLPAHFRVITLAQAGIHQDIPEPHHTLQDNAAEKARVIFGLTRRDCFSEDTGLEVTALDGAPGVHSARYAGEARSGEQNIALLLRNLEGKPDRSARFRTVICLLLGEKEHFFEGICTGTILEKPRGAGGFGYDAVFQPNGADHSFAEMTLEEKNRFSHRRKAVDMLVAFLNEQN